MRSAESDELCFVLVYFQSVTIHPVADLLYTYQELFNFVVRHQHENTVDCRLRRSVKMRTTDPAYTEG